MITQAVATRVLLIEDNPDHATLLGKMLTLGCSVRFSLSYAAQLAEALDLLVREEVDVILLDLNLPDARGFEALERLHRMFPATPIVVLTAVADEAAALEALHKGAQDYLIKGPTDPSTLDRAIRYAIERNRVVRELDRATKELQIANTRLERVALLDPLTDVLNRRGLQQALSREVRWARRHGSKLIALLLDLDEFKQINDTLGHATGDVVLKEIAGTLKRSLRETDYVARIGGDEFMILLPQTAPEEGRQIAEKIRLVISETPMASSFGAVKVTASFGVLAVSERTPSIDELLSQMHFVLSTSKQNGKNQVSHELDNVEPLAEILQLLVRGDGFRVVRQPIIRLADEQQIGYEFLSRLATGVFQQPNDFFRISLEANLLTLVDHLCFQSCIAAASTVDRQARRHLNLFPSTLISMPVEHLLEAFPSDRAPGTYCVEISEQQIIGDPLHLARPVAALKRAGIRIAFDDVGYGHSCLESLVLLEPEVIKIDKRCITGVGSNLTALRSLKRLLKLAEALGAEVVAEGIESREDLETLKWLGVTYGQGFLWERPD